MENRNHEGGLGRSALHKYFSCVVPRIRSVGPTRGGAAAEQAAHTLLRVADENLEDVLRVNGLGLHLPREGDDDAPADRFARRVENGHERVAVRGVSPTERLDARQPVFEARPRRSVYTRLSRRSIFARRSRCPILTRSTRRSVLARRSGRPVFAGSAGCPVFARRAWRPRRALRAFAPWAARGRALDHLEQHLRARQEPTPSPDPETTTCPLRAPTSNGADGTTDFFSRRPCALTACT